MEQNTYTELNEFLVKVFHTILRIEEKALTQLGVRDLSMREIHIIEAISDAKTQNQTSAIAETLGITAGSLTVAVNTLERKGYIERVKDDKDKRVVRLCLTEKAKLPNERHKAFHHEMIDAVLSQLTPEEASFLLKGLMKITHYFKEKNSTLGV